jgi:hypothetical protein
MAKMIVGQSGLKFNELCHSTINSPADGRVVYGGSVPQEILKPCCCLHMYMRSHSLLKARTRLRARIGCSGILGTQKSDGFLYLQLELVY